MLRDQVNGLPKPLTEQQTQNIAHTEADGRAGRSAEAQQEILQLLGLNIGPTFGPSRAGDVNVSGRGQFFSPFGGRRQRTPCRRRANTCTIPAITGRPVRSRSGESLGQLPGRRVCQLQVSELQAISERRRTGPGRFPGGLRLQPAAASVCSAPRASRTIAVLNSITLAPGAFLQTYARVVNQFGVSGLFGVWGKAYLSRATSGTSGATIMAIATAAAAS